MFWSLGTGVGAGAGFAGFAGAAAGAGAAGFGAAGAGAGSSGAGAGAGFGLGGAGSATDSGSACLLGGGFQGMHSSCASSNCLFSFFSFRRRSIISHELKQFGSRLSPLLLSVSSIASRNPRRRAIL